MKFYLWLNEFLQGQGNSYRKEVRIQNGTGPLPEITVSKTFSEFHLNHNMLYMAHCL